VFFFFLENKNVRLSFVQVPSENFCCVAKSDVTELFAVVVVVVWWAREISSFHIFLHTPFPPVYLRLRKKNIYGWRFRSVRHFSILKEKLKQLCCKLDASKRNSPVSIF
jgi:hypothetical protein